MAPETKNKLVFLALCLGLVFLIYGRAMLGDFVFDNRPIIEREAMLSNLNQLDKVFMAPYWARDEGLYRPITLTSFTFNFMILGSDPAGFYFVNLLLYALTGWLIFLLVDKLLSQRLLAYLCGLIFLLLPIHSEAVVNIVGRAEILALLFSLLLFLELLKNKKNYWLAGLWFFLAIGAKESAVVSLPVAALIIYLKEKYFWRKEIWLKYWTAAVWLPLSVLAYLFLRFLVLGADNFMGSRTTIVENPLKFTEFWPRIFTGFKILWLYVQKSFWPVGLCSDYSYNQIPAISSLLNWQAIAGLSVIVFLIFALFFFRKRAPLLSLGAAFFLFGFMLTANLIFPIGTIMGERLAFYPSVGASFFLGWIFYNMIAWGKFSKFSTAELGQLGWPQTVLARKFTKFAPSLPGLMAAILLLFLAIFYGAIGFLRTGDWLTEKNLFASAAKCSPASVLSRSNLGAAYYLEGNLAEAKKELLAAYKIYDGYSMGANNLGLIYFKEGDKLKAKELFLKALDSPYPYYGAYENLALLSLSEGKIEEAKDWLGKLYEDKKLIDNIIDSYLNAK